MPIKITDKAAAEIARAIEEQKSQDQSAGEMHIRLKVVGGGCSGFQSKITVETEFNEKIDERHEVNGVTIVLDKRSAMYIGDATVDFVDDLNARGFRIDNPQAKSTCGCGSSFSM